MDIKSIVEKVDHTNLKQTAVWEDIKQLCNEALEYGTASVCIAPSYVKDAKEYTKGRLKICTVIGFPNGYQTTPVKIFETENAIENGADEIDMVVNIGWVKDHRYKAVENEIRKVKVACGDRILKVIIETCLLSQEEKIELCHMMNCAGADYIKTSTGFSTAGATCEDVELFATHVGQDVKIKAAGGINSLEDAKRFIELGTDRLGTSRIVALVRSFHV